MLSIFCIGAGYLGGTTCAVLADRNPDVQVNVLDSDVELINQWNSDKLPIFEPGLEELVKSRLGKNLCFEADLSMLIYADIIFIDVNTPMKNGELDLTYIESAVRSIADHATRRKKYIIVLRSTVPVFTASKIDTLLKQIKENGVTFDVLCNPEFMAEGTAVRDLLFPDRVIIGGKPNHKPSMDILSKIYEKWVDSSKIIMMNRESCEMAKLASNAMLAQRISSINSLAMICEKVGANIGDVALGVGKDKRIGEKYLNPSIGFGGSCLEKDTLNLAHMANSLNLTEVAHYWRGIIDINKQQKQRFVEKIKNDLFSTVYGKKITIFGFTFKKDTDDIRGTPALDVCEQLLNEGARLSIYDPCVDAKKVYEILPKDKIVVCSDAYSACSESHAIVVCTEWDEFTRLNFKKIYNLMLKPACVFDGRRIFLGSLLKSTDLLFIQLEND